MLTWVVYDIVKDRDGQGGQGELFSEQFTLSPLAA
jgi:hypothetical protein